MTKRPTNKTTTNGSSPRFDVGTLREIAGDKVFARGVAYHENKQVEIIAIEKTRVLAKVVGSEVYRSELAGAGKKFTGKCSCPAFSDWGFCKHLVATALTVNDVEPGVLDETVNRFTRIRDHLHSKDVDTLVAMIMQLSDRDPTLFKDLELSALRIRLTTRRCLRNSRRPSQRLPARTASSNIARCAPGHRGSRASSTGSRA